MKNLLSFSSKVTLSREEMKRISGGVDLCYETMAGANSSCYSTNQGAVDACNRDPNCTGTKISRIH